MAACLKPIMHDTEWQPTQYIVAIIGTGSTMILRSIECLCYHVHVLGLSGQILYTKNINFEVPKFIQ